jgi:hypothetical protein
LIVGANEALATELLTSVKAELEHNEAILAIYGDIRGDTWQQTKITFRSGRWAIGRGQTRRGAGERS